MSESKSDALPLGDIPKFCILEYYTTTFPFCQHKKGGRTLFFRFLQPDSGQGADRAVQGRLGILAEGQQNVVPANRHAAVGGLLRPRGFPVASGNGTEFATI